MNCANFLKKLSISGVLSEVSGRILKYGITGRMRRFHPNLLMLLIPLIAGAAKGEGLGARAGAGVGGYFSLKNAVSGLVGEA
ncbi:MAG: hypothetical protein M3429_06155, partial [Verrucomicrobiota bacterium]|nr:hypothetical protein [Verrucomicrobiota bacterium]